MTTGVACPTPILQFFDNTGNPAIGGKVVTQVGGINAATYQDINLTVPLPNPIPLNSRGEISNAAGASTQLFLTPNTVYTFTLFDASGNQLNQAFYVNGVQLTSSIIGQTLYPQTQGEIAAAVMPVSFLYPPGDVRRYGAVCDSVTDNTQAITNAMLANGNYFPVNFYPVLGQTYNVSGRIPIPGGTVVNLNGAALLWTATTATGSPFPATSGGIATKPGFQINGSRVIINGGGGSMTGPSTSIYVAVEIGIYMQGGTLGTPISGILIRDLGLAKWGYAGILGQFTYDTTVENCHVTGCGYIGIGFLSAINSRTIRNEVDTIAPGTNSNAYGIIHSYDSANNQGNSRPGAGGETDPYSLGCVVANNFVHDIPLWDGINFHGGFDSVIHDNQVYNCMQAINLGAAPNQGGTSYGAQNMRCHHNLCDINQYNGSATTVQASGNNSYAIVLAGNTGANATDCHVNANTCIGYGLSNFDAFSINFEFVTRGSCSDNILDSWSGYGIYISNNNDTVISGNVFGAVGTGAAGDACIYSATASNAVITGNMHRPQSGTAAHFGAYINNNADNPYLLGTNDFDAATVAAYGQAGSQLTPIQMRGNSDAIPQVIIQTVTSNTISIAPAGYAREVMIFFNTSGSNTVNSITGAFPGQRITLYQESNQTTTYSRTNAKLASGANWSGAQFSTLQLLCYALSTGVPQYVELSRSTSNS